jgi:hypothetical protein
LTAGVVVKAVRDSWVELEAGVTVGLGVAGGVEVDVGSGVGVALQLWLELASWWL